MARLAALLPLDEPNQDRSLALARHLLRVGLAEGCLAIEVEGVRHLGMVAAGDPPLPEGGAVILPFRRRPCAA